jgi:chemotaxis protein MotB
MTTTSLRTLSLLGLALLVSVAGACVSATQYEMTAAERDSLAVVAAEREAELAQLQASYDSLTNLFEAEIAANELAVKQLVDGVEVEISTDIMFSSGASAANVGDDGQEFAIKLAEYLKGTDFFISVVGHTDSQQPQGGLAQRYPTNWELAAARAANAVRFLQSEGIEPSRMIAVSRGEFQPVATNSTAEGRAQNRRIQVILRRLPE